MNQSQFLAITCNSLEAREKSREHGAIGFGFDSHWLTKLRESFKPITKRSNRFRQSFENWSKSRNIYGAALLRECHLKRAHYYILLLKPYVFNVGQCASTHTSESRLILLGVFA